MKTLLALHGIREHRLIYERDLQQMFSDINTHHIQNRIGLKKPIETLGAGVMPVVAALSNGIGATVRSLTSDNPPVPLRDGAFKYTGQGLRLAAADAGAFVSSAVRLQPIKTIGNAINLGFDAFDLATRPLIDITSDAFGHISRQGAFSRSEMQTTLASAQGTEHTIARATEIPKPVRAEASYATAA